MRYIIYPYKMGSRSAKTLSEALGAIRVYPDRNYRPREDDLIINWGNSHTPNWTPRAETRYLNKTGNVAIATNKFSTFEALRHAGVRIPEFRTDKGNINFVGEVVVRHNLTGTGGDGIEIVNTGIREDLPEAPLYVQYIKPDGEYRVHVFNGQVIDYQKKRRGEEFVGNEYVRNLNNGWIYARENLDRIPENEEIALNAVNALGLNFGAVDIIRRDHKSYVLEVNTACGLEESTIISYANAIKNYEQQNF